MYIVYYQPDMAGNVGAAIRICACFGAQFELIEPCGFPPRASDLRRAAMDYGDGQEIRRHASWEDFLQAQNNRPGRLILMTTAGDVAYTDFALRPDDCLLFGRESAGAPEQVHQCADARLYIPLQASARSLNISVSAAVVLAEANRQFAQNRSN